MKFRSLFFTSLLTLALASVAHATKFEGEAEAGSIVTSGTSDTENYSGKLKMSYLEGDNTYTIGGHYLSSKADDVESARNWDVGARYDRQISERFSLFFGQKTESDVFAGVLQRDSTDLGVKYDIYKTDDFKWSVETGYRYSKTQVPNLPSTYYSLIRLYSEIEKVLDKTFTIKYWAEYLPNMTDSHDYLANTELALNIMLNTRLSLQVAYKVQYQNAPPPATKYTTTTNTLNLAAKF